MRRYLKTLPLLVATAALAGCSSTVGGTSTPYVPDMPIVIVPEEPEVPETPVGDPFTSVGDMDVSGRTLIAGTGREARFDYLPPSNPFDPNDPVIEIDVSGSATPSAMSIDVALDSSRATSGVKVNGPETVRAWESGNQFDIGNASVFAASYDGVYGTDSAVAIDPEAAGFEYQAFGAWATGVGSWLVAEGGGVDQGTVGSFSGGVTTKPEDVPGLDAGTARFTGMAVGSAVDRDGNIGNTVANAVLDANFSTRTVFFESSDTQLHDIASGTRAANAGYDVLGTMSYDPSGEMTGTAASKNGLSGNIEGRFYGPGAEEIGGTFALGGVGHEAFFGSFGGNR